MKTASTAPEGITTQLENVYLKRTRASFFFLRIFILYTFYIVWEGAGPYMGVEEKIRLKFVGFTTAIILLTPVVIEILLSMLMPGLSF